MNRLTMFFNFVLLWALCSSGASVENVRAMQRERSRTVDVWYDLVSADGGVFDVSLRIAGGGDEPPLSTVGGDIGEDIEPGRNKHIEWNAGVDWPGHLQENFIATVTATRIEEDTGPSRGMVRIPGGTNSGAVLDPWGDYEYYSLTVDSFYMDKTEVTYAHWSRVYNWAIMHGYSFTHAGAGNGTTHPVHTVNVYDCMKWCNARSEMEGRAPAYTLNEKTYRRGEETPNVDFDGNGYRLPTQVEWEYAARGGLRDKRFPWGNTISHSKANYYAAPPEDYASEEEAECDLSSGDGYHPSYNGGTAPVASFPANGYGLYDMIGNLEEWVTHAPNAFRTSYCPLESALAGGSWQNEPTDCHYVGAQNHHLYEMPNGFRTVRRR